MKQPQKGAPTIAAATVGTGAALTAALASACCVGPSIAPIAISVIGASGLVAVTYLRPFTAPLLLLSALMLAFSFRRAYASTACAQPPSRALQISRAVVWIAALLWMFALGDSIYGFLHE